MTNGDENAGFVSTTVLTRRFGDFTALDNVSVSIDRGKVVGLLGPNGSGKSTLLRLLLGFMRPTSGTAAIGGLDCYRHRNQVHQMLSYLPGDARLERGWRAINVLKFFSALRPAGDLDRAIGIADELELDLKARIAFMSTGMRQKLAIVVTMSMDAPLIILDEPTANLDPTVRQQVLKLVRKAKSQNRAVIFSSHVLSEIEQTCDEVIFLRRGQKMLHDSVAGLKGGHRLLATIGGSISVPADGSIREILRDDSRIELEIESINSQSLSWLAAAPLTDIRIESAGLQATYDQFHGLTEIGNA